MKEEDPTKTSVNFDEIPGKVIIVRDIWLVDEDVRVDDMLGRQVGVPGAFTPSCSSQVPGYIEHFEKFQSRGEYLLATCSFQGYPGADSNLEQACPEFMLSLSMTCS